MQNKASTYVLIVGFIVIWVFAGYRIYKAVHRDESVTDTTAHSIVSVNGSKIDSFQLSLQYSDPFQLRIEQQNIIPSYSIASVRVKETESPKPVQPAYKPTGIVFKGLINNSTGKRQVAIISLQGKDLLFSENETIGVMTLIKIYNQDSIFVNYDSHSVVIKR